MVHKSQLTEHIPPSCEGLLDLTDTELRTAIPELSRDWERMIEIEIAAEDLPTKHEFYQFDSTRLRTSEQPSKNGELKVENESVHLVVTSPPYYNMKEYEASDGQLGDIQDFSEFVDELRKVWEGCYEKLAPGGRLCIVVGDVLQSRGENGRHRALPLHSIIQTQCFDIGFDCLAPIIWYKIGNASIEAGNNASYLGKPYEPGGIIKNDIEYILLFRKPGGYRSPTVAERILSTIQVDYYRECFNQVWTDIQGESRKDHPAPYPKKLAERLIRMFSFVGDTVLDPFAGSGTTGVAAQSFGRDSINIELDPGYLSHAKERVEYHSR